jgi:thioredoxin-related protein
MRLFLSVALIIILHLDAHAQRRVRFIEVNTIEEWEDVLELSRDNKRLMFINVCSPWSEVCTFMRSNTFRERELARFLVNDYIPVYIQGDSEFGAVWGDRYDVSAFPMMFYMTPGERIVARLEGYQEPQTIIDSGKRAMTVYREYPRLRRAYIEGGLSPKGFRELINLELANEGSESARPLFNELIAGKPKERWLNPENLELIVTFGSAPGEEIFAFIAENREQLLMNNDFNKATYFENSFNHTMAKAVRSKDIELLRRAEEQLFLFSNMNSDEQKEMIAEMYRTFHLRTGDWDAFGAHVEKMAKRATSEETVLALEARFIIENFLEPDALNTAISLMRKSIELRDRFTKRQYLADAYLKLKEFDKAVGVLQEAKDKIRDPYDQYEVDELIRQIRRFEREEASKENENKTDK